MKISKIEFVKALVENPHVFMGVVYSGEIPEGQLVEAAKRAREAHAPKRGVFRKQTNALIFTDGSRLYFDSFAKREYRKVETGKSGTVYEMAIRENGAPFTKYLYYLV